MNNELKEQYAREIYKDTDCWTTKEIYEYFAEVVYQNEQLQNQVEKLTQENNDLEERVIHQDNVIKGLQEELQKADSITQSCIYDGKKESSLNFRKAINLVDEFRKENKHLQSVIEELEAWIKEQIEFVRDIPTFTKEIKLSHTQQIVTYQYVLDKLNELRSKE